MARISAFDNLKGIGIIFVILGHLPVSQDVFKLIYAFHMPLFFFISGYFASYEEKFKTFITRKYNSIIYPYLTFSILTYLIHYLLFFDNPATLIKPDKAFVSIIFGTPVNDYLKWNPPLWFYTSIFSIHLIFQILSKIQVKIRNGILVIFFLLGLIFSSKQLFLPWCISSSLMAIPYFFMGILVKKYQVISVIKELPFYYVVLEIILFFVISHFNYGTTNFALNTYGNLFLSIISGILGIAIFFRISFYINSIFIETLGKNSLFIFSVHVFYNAIAIRIVNSFSSYTNNFFVIIMALISIFLIYASIFIIKKMPFNSHLVKLLRII